MSLISAFLLMAQGSEPVRTDVTLRYRRPSAVVAQAQALKARLVADDARSLVAVSGTPDEVRNAKEFLRLFDVPRKTLRVRVTVTSPADHLAWTVDASLTNNQVWRTADDETKTDVTLQPRVNGDGTLNVALRVQCGGNRLTSTLRLAKGKERSFVLGKEIVQEVRIDAEKQATVKESAVPLPTIAIRYLGL